MIGVALFLLRGDTGIASAEPIRRRCQLAVISAQNFLRCSRSRERSFDRSMAPSMLASIRSKDTARPSFEGLNSIGGAAGVLHGARGPVSGRVKDSMKWLVGKLPRHSAEQMLHHWWGCHGLLVRFASAFSLLTFKDFKVYFCVVPLNWFRISH